MPRRIRKAGERVVDRPRLVELARQARKDDARIVFTNGCFDLLHTGHLNLLEQAATLGELLVVGINTDGSVRRLKGPGRPLIPFADRALLVAGLEAVDWVCGFDESSPLELIEALRPDVLVKGEDWAENRIIGREVVERSGGRIVRLPLSAGRSTSRIVERIRSRGADAPD